MSTSVQIPQVPLIGPGGLASLEWQLFFQNPQVVELLPGTVLEPISGGTGINAYSIGDIIYANGVDSLTTLGIGASGKFLRSTGTVPAWSNLTLPNTISAGSLAYGSSADVIGEIADVAAGNVLLSGGIGLAPFYGKVGLTTHVSGILPVASGGTAVDNTNQTYTPTLFSVANVAASTAYTCQYYRIGNVVTVSGKVDIDPTTAATLTQLGISLPIASAFTTEEQCAGTGAAGAVAGSVGRVYADATNDRAQFDFVPTDVANRAFSFIFSYLVI